MVAQTVTIEMKLSGTLVDQNGDTLIDENGYELIADTWIDVSADALTGSQPTWSRGNSGRTIFDRVADIGTFEFALDNSHGNTNGTAGYYSPDHGSREVMFGLDTAVRLTIAEGANTHQEWQGIISSIEPIAGRYGPRQTMIVCEDWMANAYRDRLRGITVQESKRDDQILTTLLTLTTNQPLATSFSVGDDTYTYSLHDENSLTSSMARVFQKLMMSGFGRIFLTGYSTLTYLTRSELLVSGTPDATLNDTMTSMKVSRTKAQRVNETLVTTYPVQIDTTAVVLWQSQRELTLTAAETVTFDISFRDPSERSTRVAARSLTTAVAATDYSFSSVSGSGNDLNTSLGITVELKADLATVTLTNNAGSTGYLWFHRQRGIGIYLYEPVTAYDTTGQVDGETLTVDMVYQDNQNVGLDISTLVTYWYVVDQTDVESVTFIANTNQTLMTAAFLLPGDLVTITETQTGLNSNFIINGTSKTILPGNVLQVTWFLTYANQVEGVCRLDVIGLAELDSTAILGA